ncbi:MAG: hypothetical protein ACLFTP_03325 [Rhodosalinus sp.]|uniref:hypothetical protein n=1 Tax=Rhodosalinus sp. TaxID=2047741 RepID=UPI00397D687A
MPYGEVPAFHSSLADDDPTQLALRMLILIGLRSAARRDSNNSSFNPEILR